MTKIIMIAAGLTFLTMLVGFCTDDSAMQRCQQTHSFDTCFHSLNR